MQPSPASDLGRGTSAERLSRRALRAEAIAFLRGAMPGDALGHGAASIFTALALSASGDRLALALWCLAIIALSLARLLLTRRLARRLSHLGSASVRRWSWAVLGMTLLLACAWGASAFAIWPEAPSHRAFLTAVLAGIVAAGGVVALALHSGSFWIYCLAVAGPAAAQLALAGSGFELILAGLLALYVALLLVGVDRLTRVFHGFLQLRLIMRQESRTDALTGLANRRGFDEALHDSWRQAVRAGQPLGLITLDLDYFKEYNDQYGHPKGDAALQRVALLLRQAASRSTDLCARLGGDEFAVVMPATGQAGAKQVAQDFLDRLETASLPHKGSALGRVTASLGAGACQPARDASLAAFVEQVDLALYQAKKQGRGALSFT